MGEEGGVTVVPREDPLSQIEIEQNSYHVQ